MAVDKSASKDNSYREKYLDKSLLSDYATHFLNNTQKQHSFPVSDL